MLLDKKVRDSYLSDSDSDDSDIENDEKIKIDIENDEKQMDIHNQLNLLIKSNKIKWINMTEILVKTFYFKKCIY